MISRQTAEFISTHSNICQTTSLKFIAESWEIKTQFHWVFSDSTNGQTFSSRIENLEMNLDTYLIENILRDSWEINLIDLLYYWRETLLETQISMKKWFRPGSSSSRWEKKLPIMQWLQIIVLLQQWIMLQWCNLLPGLIWICMVNQEEECQLVVLHIVLQTITITPTQV